MEIVSWIIVRSFQDTKGNVREHRQWFLDNRPDLLVRPLEEVLTKQVLKEVATAAVRKHGNDPYFESLRKAAGETVFQELRDVWNFNEDT